ncbi:MAG: glycosyltransferase [Rhodanobacter sp.]
MLIWRDYRGYTGGHGKFHDYVTHLEAHPDWSVMVYLTPDSVRDAGNPFLRMPGRLTDVWQPAKADALLVGGVDWQALPDVLDPRLPIVNLVQHVRHADAAAPMRRFLSRRAIRICNSTAVAEAVTATGEANGPLCVIDSAVDTEMLAQTGQLPCRVDVFIDAAKQPELGRAVASRLSDLRVHLHIKRLPFTDYVQAMASARIVLPLPDPTEGIYLPGLNAMAMGRALVQPDCVGSRVYVRDGENALVPPRDADALADAVRRLHDDPALQAHLVAAGLRTAVRFNMARERTQFHHLLDEIDELWQA